jgi:hypothetical protein
MSDTLLNIISKFPTKESRLHLRFILRDSSKDLQWRKEISHVFYLLHKLDCNDQNEPISSEYVESEILPEVILPEVLPEVLLPEPILQEIIFPEVILPEVILPEVILPEVIHEQEVLPKELTDIEKIQLEYEQKILNILQNK